MGIRTISQFFALRLPEVLAFYFGYSLFNLWLVMSFLHFFESMYGIYANIKGVYRWDPWHTIYSSTMDPMG